MIKYKARNRLRLGELLIKQEVITESQLDLAIEKQKSSKERLGDVLAKLGYATELEIVQALQRQLGLDVINLLSIRIGEDVCKLIPDSNLLKKYVMMPFEILSESAALCVAMADPMNLMAIDDLSIVTNMQIKPFIAPPGEIMAAIDKYYGDSEVRAVAEAYSKERATYYGNDNQEQEREDITNSPIVKLVRTIIEQAVRQRASDIHIEPQENNIRVRNRIDGVLLEVGSYSNDILSAIVTRIKILANMDISEKRKPQDGSLILIVDRMEYDIRVSTLPTVYGEKIVLRISSKSTFSKKKTDLGMFDEDIEVLDSILSNPFGMLLVTGPTGSGKSTTLYTILNELNRSNVNIVTVEDPVEVNLEGVNQVPVNMKAELTFASALRSILRQDPDVIMIGEIRDQETAKIATTASITGHLVVSTLHTNDAASTVMRLADMGVERYLIADSLVGVVAQRLVKKLCTCKKTVQATSLDKKLLGVEDQGKQLSIYEPMGCNLCNQTGYLGRIGVYEIMHITSKIHDEILSAANGRELQEKAIQEGMRTLKINARRLVLEGITSMTELKRIVFLDEESEK